MPGTYDVESVVSRIHSPVPSWTPSASPSPVKRATYRVPSVSSVMLCRRAAAPRRGSNVFFETNL